MPIDDKAVLDYMNELAEAAGIEPDKRSTFIANDKVKAAARKRFEDAEREKGRADATERKRNEEYQENLRRYNLNKQAVDEANAKVAQYVSTYGELPGGGDPGDPEARRAAVTNAIDAKTLDERLGKTEANTLGLAKAVMKITARHLRQFPEIDLDPDAITKIATEQGLTAEKAYDEWIKPERDKKQTSDFDARLKAAREEGYRDGVSKRAAGQVEDAAPRSGFFENMRKTSQDTNAPTPRAAFDDAWQGWKPPTKTT